MEAGRRSSFDRRPAASRIGSRELSSDLVTRDARRGTLGPARLHVGDHAPAQRLRGRASASALLELRELRSDGLRLLLPPHAGLLSGASVPENRRLRHTGAIFIDLVMARSPSGPSGLGSYGAE